MRCQNGVVSFLLSISLGSALVSGCQSAAHPADKPTMSAGEGGIAGKLVGTDQEPFDLSQAGDRKGKDLKIELISPASGVAAVVYPSDSDAKFAISHLHPGTYELQVYTLVPGKRTIAGSLPVTVNPGQITSVTLPLQTKSQESGS